MANLMALALVMAGCEVAINKMHAKKFLNIYAIKYGCSKRIILKLIRIFADGACLSEGIIAFRENTYIPMDAPMKMGKILSRWESKGWLTHTQRINQNTDKPYCQYVLRLPTWTGIALNKDESKEYKFLREFKRTHGMGSYYSRFWYKKAKHNAEAEYLTNTQEYTFDKEYWESLNFAEFAECLDIDDYENKEGVYDLYLREKYIIKQQYAIEGIEPFMIERGDDNRLRNYSHDELINPTSDKIDRWGLKLPYVEIADPDEVCGL